MDYGYSLSRAWEITWKFKVLWFFGILAGCSSSGSSGTSNTNYSEDFSELPPEAIEMGEKAFNFLVQPVVVIGFILLVFLIIIIKVFFTSVGRIGLISGTNKAEMGAEKLGFGELFKDGISHFWRFFGMNFLVSLPFVILIFGLLGAGIFVAFSEDNAINAEAFLANFIPTLWVILCCLFLFSLFIGMMLQQAQNAMIIEELGISASIMRGWEVFQKGLGHIILITIIVLIITIVASIAIVLPVFAIVFPSISAFPLDEASSFETLIVAGLCLIAYFPVALIINGALITYTQAIWTLTYLQLTESTPKITKEDRITEYA